MLFLALYLVYAVLVLRSRLMPRRFLVLVPLGLFFFCWLGVPLILHFAGLRPVIYRGIPLALVETVLLEWITVAIAVVYWKHASRSMKILTWAFIVLASIHTAISIALVIR